MEWVQDVLESNEPAKWLFTGDCVTHGVRYTLGGRDYVQLFEERVRGELGRHRDFVAKTAVKSWTTKDVLEDIEWSILRHKPDVVSIMLGINDCCRQLQDFKSNYLEILDKIKKRTSAHVILHTPNPIVPGTDPSREPTLPAIVEQIHQIGAQRGLHVVDHWREWKGAWREDPARIYTWMADTIHPNANGHRAFARLLFQEMQIWDQASIACGVVIP
jgi:acyl-CoA thioesterase I